MVGPETEARGQVRHVSRMFIVAAHLRVPFFAYRVAPCASADTDPG
jgi:acetyl-CoA carboxylase carboxyltransferase component